MKASIKSNLLFIIIGIVLMVLILIMFNSNKYKPISVVIPEMKSIRSLDCTKIELEYSELTSKGQGQLKKKALTEKDEIESMIDIFLQTFCWRNTLKKREGGSNVTATFFFSNHDPITIRTLADGGILVRQKYYRTNNQIGTYLTEYVMEN